MSSTSPNRKQIWLVNLFFGIGPAPTGVLLESVARQLQHEDWDVRILTGSAGYNRAAHSDRGHQTGRFTDHVIAFYCGPWNSQGRFGRLLTWLCFYLRVALYACFHRMPSVVLLMTTPPFLCWLFALRNRFARRKAALVLWNQDTFPEILAAVNVLNQRSLVYRVLESIERRGVAAMDHVIVLDEAMQQLLIAQGARELSVIPNWEINLPESEFASSSRALEALQQARQRYAFRVLYTGNYGWGHDLSGLWKFLREYPRQEDCYFAFVGGGEKWSEPTKLKEELSLDCLDVFDYVPKAQVHDLIRETEFGLVSLQAAAVGLMSPSKLHGYLALGKPVLYIGPAESNVGYALETFQCGLRIELDDDQGFADTLARLRDETFDYEQMSLQAKAAYEARYCEAVGVNDMVALLEQLLIPHAA